MAIESVEPRDFCREWTIFYRGDHHWEDLFAENARFVIVQKKAGFLFLPIIGVKPPLRKRPLTVESGTGRGRYGEGTPLEGSLVGKFDRTEVRFTLNKVDDEFVISLSDAADVGELKHGGPHGSDD